MSDARALVLLGRDYPELGPVGLVGLREGGALGLSRGAHPKAYAHVDPNEDAALLYRQGGATLLAVADGHNGVRASEIAIQILHERAAALLAASPGGLPAALAPIVSEIVERLSGAGPSRTCLVLACVTDTHCQFALFGDCSLWRAAQGESQIAANDLILGPSLRLAGVPEALWCGFFDRLAGERIALASDGVTNFMPHPAKIADLLRSAPDDLTAARWITTAALQGGAGDNVAVATLGSSEVTPTPAR